MGSTAPGFRPSLLAARERLLDGREKIKQQHQSGSPGIQVCACLTDLVDSVVLDLYRAALADLPGAASQQVESDIALVPHGGYGRRDVAPYSDVDLMILHRPGAEETVAYLAKRLMRDLFDVGLDLGQSVRTPDQACQLAKKDATIATSLIESRYLVGSLDLFNSFSEKFQKQARRRYKSLFRAIEQARREERIQYGETVYLLEPNIKRSSGGLRDIQLLRWIGSARYGTADPDDLQLLGALSKRDQRTIRRASEFLLRLRNEMHFQAGKPNDVLDRALQVRLAELYGFTGTSGILPVEQFMSEYFRHSNAVSSVAAEFLSSARPGPKLGGFIGSMFSVQVERDYRVTPHHILANKTGLAKLRSDVGEVLRLTDLANLHDKRIHPATWEAVRAAMPELSVEVDAETSKRFLSLLSQPARLGELLHRLHELGVLEKIIPAFSHARCLLQFNEYHKYTVDEHCLLAVERATDFLADRGPIGRVYRGIKQKRTLHLALLIHDLGKGFAEDHSDVGLRIAEETAQRLRLPLRETETLKFLVHKHLLMSHLAFRRDTSDDQLVVRFAVDVGSPEALDMLVVLTAADLAGVGPGVWNEWKGEVLADLYQRTLQHLAGDASAADSTERTDHRRGQVAAALRDEPDQAWFRNQIAALPTAYLYGSPANRIAAELKDLRSLKPGEVHAAGRYLAESGTAEYVVGTHEQITPGVFHKLTGALASQGLQILSAQINTLAEGLVLDRFYVVDPDFSDEPPPERIAQVTKALSQSLQSATGDSPTFRKLWRSEARRKQASLATLPTRVRTDNSTSDRFTILDIFASDRMGLLYTIARTLFELGLSVSLAKIGTYLDQVVDVFYVTDQAGQKIQDEAWLQHINARLLEAIEAMEREA